MWWEISQLYPFSEGRTLKFQDFFLSLEADKEHIWNKSTLNWWLFYAMLSEQTYLN